MLKAVGFDFDGILVKKIDKNARRKAFDYAFSKLSDLGLVAGSFSLADKYSGERYRDFFIRVLNADAGLIDRLMKLSDEYYLSLGLANIKQPIYETLEIMRSLKSKNIPFFIASNNPGNKIYLDAFFADELSDVPLISVEAGSLRASKPEPDMLVQGFKEIGVLPNSENTIYIGDKFNRDVVASIRAETLPILVFDDLAKVHKHIEGIDDLSITPNIININKAQYIDVEFQARQSKMLAFNDFSLLHEYILTRI